MLYLASLQKLKSNTSDSVRLLTCYFTPYTLSIFKISPMSEFFKVPPYKALSFFWTTSKYINTMAVYYGNLLRLGSTSSVGLRILLLNP